MLVSNAWTAASYRWFRALLGLYLLVHFAQLVPWAAEVLSNRGVLADATASPLLFAFPNVLALVDAPWATTLLLASAVLAAGAFMVGRRDRLAAVWMWYVLACIYGRNPLTANPSLPFVGWLLLTHVLLPPVPRRAADDGTWRLPPPIWLAAWIVMSLGYTYSGWTKLVSPSWLDGSALADVLQNPLARPTSFRATMLALPPIVLRLATWGALSIELLFAPLATVARLRPWVWLAAVGMHLGLLAMVDFADLTCGMLVLHAFTFDPGWLRRAPGAPFRRHDRASGDPPPPAPGRWRERLRVRPRLR